MAKTDVVSAAFQLPAFRPAQFAALCYTQGVSDLERKRDRDRIDKAIALLEEEMTAGGMEVVAVGSRALVLLLERRSKLLGLDAAEGAGAQQGQQGAVARILAAVPGKAQGG